MTQQIVSNAVAQPVVQASSVPDQRQKVDDAVYRVAALAAAALILAGAVLA